MVEACLKRHARGTLSYVITMHADHRLLGTAVSEAIKEYPWPDDLSEREVQKLAAVADETGRSPSTLIEQHRAGDGLSTNSDGDGDGDGGDEREALLEAIALHTEYTLDELRDLDADELQDLVESLDLPDDVSTQVKAGIIEARVADLEARQKDLLGNSGDDGGGDDAVDVDLEAASVGGAFASMEGDAGDDDRDGGLNSANVGGAFTGGD
jgi:hypothetical protein